MELVLKSFVACTLFKSPDTVRKNKREKYLESYTEEKHLVPKL